MGLGFNSGVSFNRVAATTANQGGGGELPYAQAHGGIAPFSGDERAWLEALNRYDYELVQAARHIHALDVKSLRLLARFAPHAVAPPPAGEQAGKRHGKTCCGFTCRECVPEAQKERGDEEKRLAQKRKADDAKQRRDERAALMELALAKRSGHQFGGDEADRGGQAREKAEAGAAPVLEAPAAAAEPVVVWDELEPG